MQPLEAAAFATIYPNLNPNPERAFPYPLPVVHVLSVGQKLSAGNVQEFSYPSGMTQVTGLLKEASKLDLPDRAELVSSLLEDLDPQPHYVSDEEVLERFEELKSGKVKGLSEEEFWKACGRP
jgi:hypothetical protein